MIRVDYFVHGRGRGHGSRSLPIIRALEEAGYELRVFGGGAASDLLRHLPTWQEREPILPGVGAIPRLILRAQADQTLLRTGKTQLVVSDGEQSVFLAARRLGVPTLAVGHDLIYTTCPLPDAVRQGVSRTHLWAEQLNTWIPTALATARVAVHFLPAEPNRPKTWIARPDDWQARSASPVPEGFILAYFRDGNGSRAAELFRAAGREVHWYGPGATDAQGGPVAALSRDRFLDEMARCSAVVGSAGSNLLSECVAFKKPILALYFPNEAEQALNARWASHLGLAESVSFGDLTEAAVASFLSRVSQGRFATSDISALPRVSEVVLRLAGDLVGSDAPRSRNA